LASLKQKRRLVLIAFLYAAILSLVALATWNPRLPVADSAIDLMLLMDESASVSRDHNDQLWASFLQRARTLPPGSRVSLLRFADRASVEIPWTAIEDADFVKPGQLQQLPRRNYLDSGASDIGSAMAAALRQVSTNRRSAIVISSDGVDTVNSDNTAFPAYTRNPGYSFFHLQAEPGQASGAVGIDSINLPPRVTAGNPLPVSIAIRSSHRNQASLEIIHNRKTVIKQDLDLQTATLTTLHYHLAPLQPGTQVVEFLLRDSQQNIIDQRQRVADADSGGQLLYIGNSTAIGSSGTALPQGWQVLRLRPGQLDSSEPFLNRLDVVLIDDLEASAIDPLVTRNLGNSIRLSATGLIVVGGPRSFGSGGYRHSQLEEMLPVNAESSRPLPASAFVFLLDRSGSMEAAGDRQSRLSDAFSAVLESARSVRAGDESALLAFDRDVQVLLPLKRRADLRSELDQPWPVQPSGGTRLTLAIDRATQLLAGSASQQRFLILVTDGFVEVEDIEKLEAALRQANIRLIALATGNDANLETLQRLSTSSGGRVLHVADSAELPRFMRQQLEITQQSWSDQAVTPQTLLQPPFIAETIDDWRDLQGHQVTRAKATAEVYLATPRGDPLLATRRYGAGRVAALPGGMLETRSSESLSQALIGWMNSRQQNPNLHISYRYASTQLTLEVDALGPDNNWQTQAPAEVTLTHPTGASQVQALRMEAPGRFSATLDVAATGVYRAVINIGNQRSMTSLHINNDAERMHDKVAAWFQKALDTGAILPWTETTLADLLDSESTGYETGSMWVLLALSCFLGLMALQYSFAFSWLGKRLRKQQGREST